MRVFLFIYKEHIQKKALIRNHQDLFKTHSIFDPQKIKRKGFPRKKGEQSVRYLIIISIYR